MRPFLLTLAFGLVLALVVHCPGERTAPPSSTGGSVVEKPGLTLPEGCADRGTCTADYLSYPKRAARWSAPITEEQLEAALDKIEGPNDSVTPDSPRGEELRRVLTEAMNIGHLLDGLDERTLEFSRYPLPPIGDVQQERLVLSDPYVGRFSALLLRPGSEVPLPAVIAYPGHSEGINKHRDDRYGLSLARRGYVVLILDPRANDSDEHESQVARELLLAGFPFIGLRVYEILLGRKFLRALNTVDTRNIGLYGHSGGSVAGNLVVRLDNGFSAYVSDLFSTYGIVQEREDGLLGDETSPQLYYWHPRIEDLDTALSPTLMEPYGFEDGPERMFRFFEQHLSG